MADSRKPGPQPFNAVLFGSPSSGLSLGLGDEEFSSPLSLAPALVPGVSSNASPGAHPPPPSSQVLSQPPRSSPSGTPPRQSPQMERKSIRSGSGVPAGVESTPGGCATISAAELSTVPLDSPLAATDTPSPAGPPVMPTPEIFRSSSERGGAPLHPPGPIGPGWNDPPMLSLYAQSPRGPGRAGTTGSEPSLDTSVDSYPIQPLANKPVVMRTNADITGGSPATSSHPSATYASIAAHRGPATNATLPPSSSHMGPPGTSMSSPLPSGSGPPPQTGSGGANPYRMGLVGARKAAGGYVPVTGPPPQPISQPMMGVVPSSLPQMQPPPHSQPMIPAMPQVQPTMEQPPPPTRSLPMAAIPQSPPHPFAAHPLTNVSVHEGAEPGTGSAQPALQHWFFLRAGEKYWIPFSMVDSGRLEEALTNTGGDISQEILVPTDGGRYDVNLHSRVRQAVYWDEPPSEVRRCSWFYRGAGDRWYLPYDEDTAARLEEEYLSAQSYSAWNRRVDLTAGEAIIMHSPTGLVHYPSSHFKPTIDHEEEYSHPKTVLRGFAEVDKVEQGEQSRVDHLVFVVHGIGQSCEQLTFKSLVDCVDDFREVSQLMLQTHRFTRQAARDGDTGGRVEFLPIHWRNALRGDDWGVESGLKPLTLPSISRLRDFSNSAFLDILYYTSPMYCQTIVSHVAMEMNRMFEVFRQRNPGFQGGVSVMGHSLGSCILFDLLNHQCKPGESSQQDVSVQDSSIHREDEREAEEEEDEEETGPEPTLEGALEQLGLTDLMEAFQKEKMDFESLIMCTNDDLKELGLGMGPRKKLTSYIRDQNEKQQIAEERRIRQEAKHQARELERQRKMEIEAANSSSGLQVVKLVKAVGGTGQLFVDYPQLNFQPQCLFAVGSSIGLFVTVRGVGNFGSTFQLPNCCRVFNIFHPFDPVAYRIEPLVCESVPEKPVLMPHHKGRKRFHLELYENLGQMGARFKQSVVEGMRNMWNQLNEIARSHTSVQGADQLTQEETESTMDKEDSPVPEPEAIVEPLTGQLNQGRRVDHVLQEKPIEKLNEYLFALSSHLCYWRSEDTALFLLKEVYDEPNPELIRS